MSIEKIIKMNIANGIDKCFVELYKSTDINKLIYSYIKDYIRNHLKRFDSPGIVFGSNLEDIQLECSLAVFEALKKHDSTKGKFTTFSYNFIISAISKACKKYNIFNEHKEQSLYSDDGTLNDTLLIKKAIFSEKYNRVENERESINKIFSIADTIGAMEMVDNKVISLYCRDSKEQKEICNELAISEIEFCNRRRDKLHPQLQQKRIRQIRHELSIFPQLKKVNFESDFNELYEWKARSKQYQLKKNSNEKDDKKYENFLEKLNIQPVEKLKDLQIVFKEKVFADIFDEEYQKVTIMYKGETNEK